MIVDVYLQRESEIVGLGGRPDLDFALETVALVMALAEAKHIGFSGSFKASFQSQDPQRIYDTLVAWVPELGKVILERRRIGDTERFASLLGRSFHYEFSEADLIRIQFLLNVLRDEISTHKGLELAHKERLLGKLEDLQKSLHRRTSNLDKFYGLVGDAGILLGKFGHDAKPLVDRIRELM